MNPRPAQSGKRTPERKAEKRGADGGGQRWVLEDLPSNKKRKMRVSLGEGAGSGEISSRPQRGQRCQGDASQVGAKGAKCKLIRP